MEVEGGFRFSPMIGKLLLMAVTGGVRRGPENVSKSTPPNPVCKDFGQILGIWRSGPKSEI